MPPNKDRRLLDQWAALRQTTTVADYTTRLYNVGMQIPGITKSQILDKFLRGLKTKTRMELELKDPATLDEAVRLADRYDTIMFGRTSFANQRPGRKELTNEYEPGGEPMQLDALRTPSKGQKSSSEKPKGQQHKDQQPALKKLTPEERDHLRNIGACFKCRKTGHMAKECPTNSKNSKDQ
jgi:hypothetical protein